MTIKEIGFKEALRRGEKWALKEFYNKLSSSRDDSTFWNELISLVPKKIRQDEGEIIQALRLNLDGSFDTFLKSIPIHILAAFLMLAMLFSSCNQAGEKKTEQSNLSSIGNTSMAKTDEDTKVEEPEEATSPDELNVDDLDEDDIRLFLNDYIVKAQLPASEKRRLKALLSSAKEEAVMGAKNDLSKLFKENNPVQIAKILEQMVLFEAAKTDTVPIKPHNVTKYKGANFNNEKLPPMQTAYKGVNFK